MLAASIPAHAPALAGFDPLDWGLVLLVAVSAVSAFMRGLIRSVVSLLGVVLGLVLAAWYAPLLAPHLARWIPGKPLSQVVAFGAIVAAVYAAACLLGRMLRGATELIGLGFADRLGGAVFGVARTVVVLAALLVPLQPFLPLLPFAADSVLLPYLRSAAIGVSFVMPQDFGKRLATELRQVSPGITKGSAALPRKAAKFREESTNEGDAP